jgi:cytoplasmic iron level regulating protein YaaA (DUF328/UPF0246 family)
MIVILSPAKSIDNSRKSIISTHSDVCFPNEADVLMTKLKKLKPKKIAELMDISHDLAELNFQRYQQWQSAAEPFEPFQAMFGFNGEVYRGLDALSMKKSEVEFAQNHLRILSGLYGILKPLDLISPYRLEMGTSLPISAKHKNLYAFWGDKIANKLNDELHGEALINLASQEYFKAVNFKKIKSAIITPSFLDAKGGEYKSIQVYAKKARGLMARYIINNRIQKPEDILSFDTDGYSYNERLSTATSWIFTRG